MEFWFKNDIFLIEVLYPIYFFSLFPHFMIDKNKQFKNLILLIFIIFLYFK